MNFESIATKLIVNSGNARSKAMESISLAKNGEISAARAKCKESSESLSAAHKLQAEIIGQESEGAGGIVSLLIIHAQDHLMNALTIKELANEFIDMYELLGTKGLR